MIVEPGIYKRSDVDYDAIDAVNQSTLKTIGKSPLHYRHRLETDPDETDTMRLGTLAHAVLLEPDRVSLDFAVWPPDERMPPRRAGKLWDAFVARHADDRTIVRREDIAAAEGMRDAIRRSKLAMRYLCRGQSEPVLVWRDKETGILCKARLDFISHAVANVMCEVKTARDISPWAFQTVFARRDYDVQTAFYRDGWEAVTGKPLYPKCIAVENTEPHDVIVYDLDQVVDVGRELYREMLVKLVACRKSNQWPGQASAEVPLMLPKWRDPNEEDAGLGGVDLQWAAADE
jgi:hypothetical protein